MQERYEMIQTHILWQACSAKYLQEKMMENVYIGTNKAIFMSRASLLTNYK